MNTAILDQFKVVEELGFASILAHKPLGILMIRYKEAETIDPQKAISVIEIVKPYLEKGYNLGLTDATAAYLNITKEARKIYSDNESIAKTIAHAVVVKDLNTRILVNVFIKFDKPITPVRLFNSFEKAIDWLEKKRV